MGTRNIEENIPCCPRIFQKDLLFRRNFTWAFRKGILKGPILMKFTEEDICAEDRTGI